MMDNQLCFVEHFLPGEDDSEYLKSLGHLQFPIKNKSKIQNTHITNFMFEQDKNLKQETFLLCFDLVDKQTNELNEALKITDGMTGRQFLFKIQGYVHGQTVFTDNIHYLLKGGKLMKCALETMNNYRDMINKAQFAKPNEIVDQNYIYEDHRHLFHPIPLFDSKGRRINYMRKRNFLVRAANLPK